MTNSYDVAHGLSQDAPGPLEPVEIAKQDDTLARTGNTARDQEMYAAGIRTGEENAKHNAAIRAGVPDGWTLVPIEPTDAMLDAGIKQHRCEQGDPWYSSPDLGEGDCRDIYAAMLNAASSAPGVSTVADAQVPEFGLEAAAKTLAECMDYPWEWMSEKGRSQMRLHAQAIIDAARAAQRKGDA